MTEILTESFCERCGTRYTFESSAPRKSRVGRVRMAAKGVKNFVMSDEASFSEAMADARGEEELAATAHQLDAFHKTFNFCLTCRQYTCGDCWNPSEGRCLTCAPMAGIAEPEYAPAPLAAAGAAAPTNGYHEDAPPESWPEADLTQDRLARALGTDAAFAAAAAAADEVPSQLEVDAANDAFAEPAVDEDAPVSAVAAETIEAPVLDLEPEPSPVDAFVDPAADLELDEDLPLGGYDVADAPLAEVVAAEAVDSETAAQIEDATPATAGEAEEDAEYEAQVAAAEQDATVEAVMDPTFDYELEDADAGVAGVAPGQSLEEAVAAYEARLAAEERESVASPAVVASAAVTQPEPDAVVDAPVVAEAVEPDAEGDALIAEAIEPVVEAPTVAEAVEPEIEAPVVAESVEPEVDEHIAEAALAALAVAHVAAPEADEPVAETALAPAAAVAEPVVDGVAAEEPVLSAEPEVVTEEPAIAEPEVVAEEPVLAVAEEPVLAPEPEVVVEEPVAAAAAADVAAWPAEDLPATAEPVSDEAIDAALLLALARDAESVVAEPEPVVAEPEPVIAEPEPVAAVIEPEPEPVAAEPEPVAPAAEPQPEPVAAAPEPRTDVVPQPTWPTPATPAAPPVAAPAPTPDASPDAVPWLMVAPAEEAGRPEPQWPATPVWRAGARNTDAPTTLAGRTLLPQPDTSALWAASAQQVLSGSPADIAVATAVAQPCVQCGLSLSANARFCRRCGTRQG